jgi:geranylgeranyl pyrophosphate synthase
LPVLYGIARKGRFAKRWDQSPIRFEEVAELAQILKDESAYEFAQHEGTRFTDQALSTLKTSNPMGESGAALMELTYKLLRRES